jgi:HK97 family phage major capsid protein
MAKTAEEIRQSIEANLVRARDIAAAAEGENRSLTIEEQTNIKAAIEDVGKFRAQLEQIHGDAELRKQITNLSDEFKATPTTTPSGSTVQAPIRATAGQQFLDTPEIEAWRKNLVRSGAATSAAFGHSPRVVTNALISLGGSLSAGEMTIPAQSGILVPYPRRPLTIEDVITVGDTGSDVVEYVEVTTETNNAATVAEATSTGSGGNKPESDATFTRKTATVRTIAHWVAATRQALSDAGQLRTYIDNFLRDGLLQELEDQIIAGGGTGEDFSGLMTAAGLTQAYSTNLFETTRKARTNLTLNGRVRPNAWLIHPNDWEDFELTQDNENRYYGAGPFSMEENGRLWRVPVIEHEAVTEGFALLGDFRKAVLWKRSDPEVMISDSHSDFFVRNLIAILAEMRAAFALVFPKAVIKVDLTA